MNALLLLRRSARICQLFAVFALASVIAQGAVSGNFATDGNGTLVTVSLGSLVFGATPNLKVGSSTLTFFGGSLATGTTGTISNITGVFPLDPFMTFTGTPLDFKLTGIGPGDLTDPHDCSTATSNGKSCSLLLPGGAVSPVVLTFDNGGTDATLFVFGTATDGSGITSTWTGHLGATLTANISAITSPPGASVPPTPVNIFNYFTANPGGAIITTHSDTFAVTVPEPDALISTFAGLGLILASVVRRRR